MTAIVGFLNKHGVALAADSAVTVNTPNGHKIFNTANKIIRISKYHPIAVMVYGSADLMTTPWEIIIKLYRKSLEKKSFSTLEGYVLDFITFLKNNDYFTREDISSSFFVDSIRTLLQELQNTVISSIGCSISDENISYIYAQMHRIMQEWNEKFVLASKCSAFDRYKFREFSKYFDKHVNLENLNLAVKIDEKLTSLLKEMTYNYICSNVMLAKSGLVFAGYGDSDIYPSLISIDVSFVVDNKLRYWLDPNSSAHISPENTAAIRPFAQTDVMNTILSGIDNSILNFVFKTQELIVKNIIETISDVVDEQLKLKIKAIDPVAISGIYKKKTQDFIRENYVRQLMDTVEYLGKEDLVAMAESLISLTSLKRRMTSSEESVGGPVDVAFISKGDGFVWIKRKLYFDKELNPQFNDLYYQ